MHHSNSIQKAINDLVNFKNDFEIMVDGEIAELEKSATISKSSKIDNLSSDEMTCDELQEFLDFESSILSKLMMFTNLYMDKIKSNDIILCKKKQSSTTN